MINFSPFRVNPPPKRRSVEEFPHRHPNSWMCELRQLDDYSKYCTTGDRLSQRGSCQRVKAYREHLPGGNLVATF
ncbi:hypothetical protein NIES39_O05430 [Arthrospira platensis NIES-39]|nr:hypothetical protein NIES39_O05430 [Arthrospira platensis NIES-39]